MVDSAEGENAVHRHKMALREIQQRKLAQERLGKFQKISGEEKVRDISDKRFKGQQAGKEAYENPRKMDESLNEAAEEEMAKNPGKEEEIKDEKKTTKEQLYKFRNIVKDALKEPKNVKESIRQQKRFFHDFNEWVDQKLFQKVPIFGKNWLSREVIKGVFGAGLDEIMDAMGLPFQAASVISLLTTGHAKGATLRNIALAGSRFAIKMIQAHFVAEAYRDPDTQRGSMKLAKYRKKYYSWQMKKGREWASNQ